MSLNPLFRALIFQVKRLNLILYYEFTKSLRKRVFSDFYDIIFVMYLINISSYHSNTQRSNFPGT